MPTLVDHHYGKSRVRLVRVTRQADWHALQEVNVSLLLEGDFAESYSDGDNSRILPTDTMKNTVYALARKKPFTEIEEFGRNLVEHFLAGNPQISRVTIDLEESLWARIAGHGTAFRRTGPETRTAQVTGSHGATVIGAGLDHLIVLKTANSGFEGYIHDDWTTLKETADRLFGTEIRATWLYSRAGIDFGACWSSVRDTILACFARHESRAVQHTLYAVATAVLAAHDMVEEIHLAMPNKHCLLVDLAPFGLDNPNEIFVPIDEPSGYIEATVRRTARVS